MTQVREPSPTVAFVDEYCGAVFKEVRECEQLTFLQVFVATCLLLPQIHLFHLPKFSQGSLAYSLMTPFHPLLPK